MSTLLTAEEARKKTIESSFTLDHIAKEINEQAKRNLTTLHWYVRDMDPEVLNYIKGQLHTAGYIVSMDSED